MDVGGKAIYIMSIQRSLFAPHIVWFEKDGRFWIRNNNGKEQMDVHQLRRAFLQSEEWEKQADNFRRKRLMDIQSLDFIRDLDFDFPYFIHIVPLRPGDSRIEVSVLKEHLPKLQAIPFVTWQASVNLDGVLLSLGNAKTQAYIRGFRNGSVEIFTSAPREQVKIGQESTWTINGLLLETYSVDYLQRFLEYATHVNISPPVVVFVSLLNVKGIYLFANPAWIKHMDPDHKRFDRDVVLLPGMIVDNFDKHALDILTPCFDLLWQAAGWDQSAMRGFWAKHREQSKQ